MQTLPETIACNGAVEWFADTLEGRLHDVFTGTIGNGKANDHSSIYWRPQGTGVLWQNQMTPLHPTYGKIGYKTSDAGWKVLSFDGTVTQNVRISERLGDDEGLFISGAKGLQASVYESDVMPPEPDVTADSEIGGVRIRCVGSQYIVSNDHYTVILQRQGGVIRKLSADGHVLAENHDLYGDQDYFEVRSANRIAAGNDVESGITIKGIDDKLVMRFEGKLRGAHRFARKRPALWFRNEYVFDASGQFRQSWSFLTDDAEFRDKKAFLTWYIARVHADKFQFLRDDQMIASGEITQSGSRLAETSGSEPPDSIKFTSDGICWSLDNIETPDDVDCNFFAAGRLFFITLLDGPKPVSMDADRWYAFSAVWNLNGGE